MYGHANRTNSVTISILAPNVADVPASDVRGPPYPDTIAI